jgi:hypothetical protein
MVLAANGWFYYSGATPAVGIVANAWNLYCMSMGPCDGTYRLNGQNLFTGASVVGAFNGLAFNTAGNYPGDTTAFSLGDVMVWNRRLTTPELEQVEGYMAWTYGLASTTALVAGHAYKAARPLVVASPLPGVPSPSVAPGVTTYIGVANQSAAILRTVAGTGTAGAPGWENGYPALNAQVKPFRMTFDAWRNRLLFSDRDNHVIRAISVTSGRITTLAGVAGAAGYVDSAMPQLEVRLNGPRGLAVAPDGTIVVCDFANHAIRAIWPNSTVTTIAGTGTAGFRDGVARTAQVSGPEDVAYDGSDPATPFNFVIADGANNRVRRLFQNASGLWLVTIGGTGGTTWAGVGASTATVMGLPTSVAVSATGDVYVALSSPAFYILRITGSSAASPPRGCRP